MFEFINWLSGRETTRDELGYRGGKDWFTPPDPDRVSEIRQGLAPSAQGSARETWEYRL